MHVCRRNWHARDESFARHPEIAERIIVCDVALVAPEKMDAVPWRFVAIGARGPELVHFRRSMPSGKRDREAASLRDGIANNRERFVHRGAAERVEVGEDFGVHAHGFTYGFIY